MKTASAGLKAHMAGEVTTLATCWHITRLDATEFFFTDHDADLVISGDTYVSAVGYSRTAIHSGTDTAVDNLDLSGIFDDATITDDDLRSGLFDGADVEVFLVNWGDLTQGIMRLRKGFLGEVSMSPSGTFETSLMGFGQVMQQNVGDLYLPTCRVDLGSTKCGIDLVGGGWKISATVATVTSARVFTITYTEVRAVDGWFVDGVVEWATGENSGRAMEVKGWTQSTATVTLFLPMPRTVTVGDTLTIYPGCNKSSHCKDRFNNIVNMRAEPFVPGLDGLLQTPQTAI